MQAIEIVVIVVSVLFVIGVGIWAFIRKKQGKSTCGCGECDGNCAKCKQALENAQKDLKNKQQNNLNNLNN